jgi:NAD+ synthase (glutamine-hydrolysing)
MTRLVLQGIESGENPQVLIDLHRICGEEKGSTWVPKSPQEIANRIFCVRTLDLMPSLL